MTKQTSQVTLIQGFTRRKIEEIQKKYLQGDSTARADLAHFRQASGKPLGSTPETWSVFKGGFPEQLLGRGEGPNYAERAVFHAITLYALHQQSKTDRPMHLIPEADEHGKQPRLGIGEAVRRIANPSNPDESKAILRRFNAITTAQTFEALVYHLRGLVQLLRTESIPLDYGLLAADLYRLQFPEARQSVHLNWARQLYRVHKES